MSLRCSPGIKRRLFGVLSLFLFALLVPITSHLHATADQAATPTITLNSPESSLNSPTIVYFTADESQFLAGSTVALHWKFVGAPRAYITSDPSGRHRSYVKTNLAPEGSLEVSVASLFKDGGIIDLILVLTGSDGTTELRRPDSAYYAAHIYATFISDISIDFFKADVSTADPGQTVTLSWRTSLATKVMVTETSLSQFSPYATFTDLKPTDSLQVTLPRNVYYAMSFVLSLENANGPAPSSSLTVQIRCPTSYFFPLPGAYGPNCPADVARQVQAAYQPFQNGFMVWRIDTHESEALLTHPIAAPSLIRIPDTWQNGDTLETLRPPMGLYQPVRGFGKAWLSTIYGRPLKDQLGWATAPEQGYTMTVQPEAPRYWKYTHGEFFSLPDGRVIRDGGESWVLVQ